VRPLETRPGISHAFHLYVVRVTDRQQVYERLRALGIGANVHYIPVHLHPYYRRRFGFGTGLCPVAEAAYEQILSLPVFPAMSDDDVTYVIDAMRESIST
jgi:perosamine synthetase